MIVAVRAAVLVAVSIYRISPLGFFVGPERTLNGPICSK